MPRRPPLPIAVALALTVIAAACGSSGDGRTATGPGEVASPAVSADLPTTAATTDTPAAAAGQTSWPLTGRPLGDSTAEHPALVVKIDNDPTARPQIGLNQADLVYEVEVEGVTRFAAVFHSADSLVGPVRSARSSDIDLVGNLSNPLFAWSGANPTVTGEVMAAEAGGGLVNLAHEAFGDLYWRDTGRSAPHNLYSDTGLLRSRTPEGSTPPTPVFEYRDGQPFPEGGLATAGVSVDFRGDGRIAALEWIWDEARGGWTRFQTDYRHADQTAAHLDGGGQTITPQNVVILFVDYTISAAGGGSPQALTVGTGDALVLTEGLAIGAHWERPTAGDPIRLATPSGEPVQLAAGRTWVELPLPGHADWISADRAAFLLSTL